MSKLFDDRLRADGSPAAHAESSFSFFNRAAGEYWSGVRGELERWYRDFPDADDDLRRRFRSPNDAHHEAAWWELYLHRSLTKLGFEVEVHPVLADTTARPDFAATRDGQTVFIEALSVDSGIIDESRHQARENELMDAIDAIRRPLWSVALHFDQVGPESARRRRIVTRIESWLDDLREPLDADGRPHETEIHDRGWRICLTAFRNDPPANEGDRLIGVGPSLVGSVNDFEKLTSALRRKTNRYGRRESPVILAVRSLSTFVKDSDITNVLFGRMAVEFEMNVPDSARWVRTPDGLWRNPQGWVNSQISGLLVGNRLSTVTCARNSPQLWLHPSPDHQIDVDFPFATVHIADGELVTAAETLSPSEWLGLPEGWPGSEPWRD